MQGFISIFLLIYINILYYYSGINLTFVLSQTEPHNPSGKKDTP